jgi:hypothetical protein
MARNFVSATVAAALCLFSVAPGVAAAQDYRFAGFDPPRGATATVNLRVPMGREHRDRASYGLTLGYGQTSGMPGMTGQTTSRAVSVADFRFIGSDLRQARVASFDLANLDQDRRVSNLTNPDTTWWVVGGLVLVGVAVCLLAECFDDDDEDSPDLD